MPKMKLDREKQAQLGLHGGGLAVAGGVMRYVVGVVQRERERLAQIFERHGLADVATEILDTSLDDQVFKWRGPEHDLQEPALPAPERDKKG